MKRWFSLLLALVLACAQLPGPMAIALGEENAPEEFPVEAVEADTEVEADVEELLPDNEDAGEEPLAGDGAVVTALPEEAASVEEDADGEMLFDLEETEPGDEEEETSEEESEADAAYAGAASYGRVEGGEAPVYAGEADEAAFAWIDEGAVVLLTGEAGAERDGIAFDTGAGVATGWLDAGRLALLTEEETSEYMDAAAANSPVSLYNDDPDMPMLEVSCRFAAEEEPSGDAEEAGEGALAEAMEMPEEEFSLAEVLDAGDAPEVVGEGAPDEEEINTDPNDTDSGIEDVTDNDGTTNDGNGPDDGDMPPAAPAMSPSYLIIGVGQQSEALRVSAANTAYVLESSDPDIAVVNDDNTVTGLAEGSAIVSAIVNDEAIASCLVVVEKAPESVTLNADEVHLGEGDDTYCLTAEVPEDAHQEDLDWASSDPDSVSVDEGRLTAIKATSEPVTITVSTYNACQASCSVVVANAPATVTMASSVKMYVGQKLTPSVSVLDANGASCDVARVAYRSSDTSVVTVDSTGRLTARSKGTATVTAAAYNGVMATVDVKVLAAVTSLTLAPKKKPTTGYLGVGQVFSGWKRTLKPSGAYAYSYTYTSSNNSVLKILDAKTGKFKALKKGTAKITVKTANGKKATYSFTVRKAPSKLSLSPAKGKLTVGKSARYKYSLNGAGGSYTFTSSNPKVATISSSGKVKALKAGTTKITLKTYNGKKKTATLRVYKKSYAGLPNYLTSNVGSYSKSMSNAKKLEYVIYVAQNKLGKPYVYGGGYNGKGNKFDCSGLTYYCFKQIGIRLKASAYGQGYKDKYKTITKIGQLRRGDIVCFNTEKDKDLSDHVGIYLGNGYFIHASSSARKVIISQFVSRSSNYYKRRFSWGRRILS